MQGSEDEAFSYALDQSYAMIQDERPLERERAITKLEESLTNFGGNKGTLFLSHLCYFISFLITLKSNYRLALAARRMKEAVLRMATEDKWTSRKASLQLVSLMLEFGLVNEMERVIEEVVRSQLEHEEPRVRLQAAETLGRAASNLSSRSRLWSHFAQPIMALIHDFEERLPVSFADNIKRSTESAVFNPPKPDELRHATEGWGPLESALRALLHIIQGYYSNPFDPSAEPTVQPTLELPSQVSSTNSAATSSSTSNSSQSSVYFTLFPITQEMMETLIRMTKHQNRFVRETSFLVLSTLFEGEEKRVMHQRKADSTKGPGSSSGDQKQNSTISDSQSLPKVDIMNYLQRMASVIRDGMLDDWSHVVLGASGACRSLLFFLRTLAYSSPSASIYEGIEAVFKAKYRGGMGQEARQEARWFFDAFEVLLPALCLNRYTMAEGLRNYTLGTWKRVVLNDGPRLVSLFLRQTVLPFYLDCIESHNATTRETASYCLGELVQKIPKARGDGGGDDSDDDDDDEDDPKKGSNGPNNDDHGRKSPRKPRKSVVVTIEEALRRLARDGSWPVRDASMSSLSLFVLNVNPNSIDDVELSALTAVIEERLEDPLASVRQSASNALISFLERMIHDELQVSDDSGGNGIVTTSTISPQNSDPKGFAQRLKIKEGGKDSGDGGDSDSDSDEEGNSYSKEPANNSPSDFPSSRSTSSIAKYVNYILHLIESKLQLFLDSGVVVDHHSHSHSHDASSSHPHNHGHHHVAKKEKSAHSDSQVSKHVLETGEKLFGPLSKMRRDNDPDLHKEQEIFGCECHSTPHTCKAHPLTSQKREYWEISQSALFLLASLVHALTDLDNPESSSLAASDPSKRKRPASKRKMAFIAPFLPRLSKVTSLIAQLLNDTKRLFAKYGNWQTSLVETLEKILKDVSALPSALFPVAGLRYVLPIGENASNNTPSEIIPGQSWKSIISVLFRIIADEEKLSSTAVARGSLPHHGMPLNPMAPRGMAPGGPGIHPTAVPSSSSSFGSGPAISSPFAINPATMSAQPGSYAAAIKPSVARASSSMLLVDACASLLVALHNIFGSSFVMDTSRSEEEKAIFKRRCGPLLSGGPSRGFPF